MFTDKKYQIIYADPPWAREVWSEKAQPHSGEKHYPTMSIDELCNLPVIEIANNNSVLFMWAVGFELAAAMRVMESWGFEYKTIAFIWVKTNKNGSLWKGLGHWTRQGGEICLLGKRGNIQRNSKNVNQVLISKRSKHSKKPPEIRNRIVELMGDLPKIELFARQRLEGWDVWGLEAPGTIQKNIAGYMPRDLARGEDKPEGGQALGCDSGSESGLS